MGTADLRDGLGHRGCSVNRSCELYHHSHLLSEQMFAKPKFWQGTSLLLGLRKRRKRGALSANLRALLEFNRQPYHPTTPTSGPTCIHTWTILPPSPTTFNLLTFIEQSLVYAIFMLFLI